MNGHGRNAVSRETRSQLIWFWNFFFFRLFGLGIFFFSLFGLGIDLIMVRIFRSVIITFLTVEWFMHQVRSRKR